MKKLFFTLLLITLVLSFTVAQETVVVKGQELKIPEDYEELKDSYIEMAELYLEAEEDLEKALENNDELITKNKELNKLVDKAQENTQKAVDNTETLIGNQEVLIQDVDTLIEETEYWMNKKEYITLSPSLLYVNNFFNTEPQIGLGVQTELLNSFTVSAYYVPVDSYAISLSYKIFSY